MCETKSVSALLACSRNFGVFNNQTMPIIPELIGTLVYLSEYLFGIAQDAMKKAKCNSNPQAGLDMMRNCCKYAFAKGVEAAMRWSDSPEGSIELFFYPEDLITLTCETGLGKERDHQIQATLEWGDILYEAHFSCIQELLENEDCKEDEMELIIRTEMKETLIWIPRIAIAFSIIKGIIVV